MGSDKTNVFLVAIVGIVAVAGLVFLFSENNYSKKDGSPTGEAVFSSVKTCDIDLLNYPGIFINKGNFNGIFVIGDNAPAIMTLSLIDIANSLKQQVTIAPSASKLYSEIKKNPYGRNMILIGTPCDNPLIHKLLGTSTPCQDIFSLTGNAPSGAIKLFNNGGKTQLVVSGYGGDQVRTAAKVLANYQKYPLRGQSVKVEGKIGNPHIELEDGTSYDLIISNSFCKHLFGLLVGEEAIILDTKYKLGYIDSDSAKFEINGETSEKVAIGETFTTSLGKEIILADTLYQSYAGGVHSATLCVK